MLLSDGDGFYLRKQTRDSASWALRYRFAGRENWLTLGNYPDMSLAQARIEARQARVLLDSQQNPLSVRRAALAEERRKGSLKALCEDWYRAEVQARGLKHPAVPRRHLDRYLLPRFGRIASDITPADIARLLDELKGRAPTAANDLLRFTRRIFALCVRKGELLGARWTEFDLDGETLAGAVWHLPASRTKTGESLDIPLAPAVVAWFNALRVLAAGSDYVFPKRRRDPRERVPHVGIDTLNVALKRVKHGLADFTLHDLRRTARTHLAALGVRREVAERCLGHKLRGVEGTYDRHDYFEERRLALGQWTALLRDAERGVRRVTPIRQAVRRRSDTSPYGSIPNRLGC